ncbi:MAG: HAMP domain-containing sensor histidine kinase [Bacteroidia bacterium]
MKKVWLFITFSSLSLLAVLAIQISWILHAADVKEEMFNEKANIILSRTAEALSHDTAACNNLRIFGSKHEKHKMDSILNHYMRLYNFQIDYYFELNTEVTPTFKIFSQQNNSYQTCISEKPGKKAIELKLKFPKKEKFILGEMSILFGTSIVLIVLVIGVLWITTLSLVKEKKISEQTKELLNNMTHEFKTPLTNITLANKMIIKEIENEDKIKHYSSIITHENEKLKQQVELALHIAAFEKNEIPLSFNHHNMHDLLKDVETRFKVQTDVRNMSFKNEFSAIKYFVKSDKLHLHLAIANIIDNAVKYSNAGTNICIKTKNRDRFLVIEIIDEGIGIDSSFHQKIFDKFFRVPTGNIHAIKGFGLGLAYSKKIIEMHNGEITVESEKDKGSVFVITLPYIETEN